MVLAKTYVARSSIHGHGLFAAERLPMGSPIWRFLPGFDQEFTPGQWASLPEPARAHVRWYCFVRKPDLHVILSGDHACFINHHPQPNTGAPPDFRTPVTTVALRDIAAGEEITCDYRSYDADAPWKLGEVPADAPLGAGSQG